MRLTNTFGGRPAYYDRNPTEIITIGYAGVGVAPHAVTQRASYTVPSARKALSNDLSIATYRATVAGTAGKVSGSIHRSGAAGQWLAESASNVVGTMSDKSSASGRVILAGSLLVINTADLSTTGTVDYDIYAQLTEFDA